MDDSYPISADILSHHVKLTPSMCNILLVSITLLGFLHYYDVDINGKKIVVSKLATLSASYEDVLRNAFAVRAHKVLDLSAKPTSIEIWDTINSPLTIYGPCIYFKEGRFYFENYTS